MVDVERVSEFYFNRPPAEPRFLAVEECDARDERDRVENCLGIRRRRG